MTKVKICGLRRLEDVEAVNHALPDYAGFVFAKGRRQVSPAQAQQLQYALDSRIQAVGVFVNAPVEMIAQLFSQGVIDIAQLHGEEDARYMQSLRALCAVPIIKSVAIADHLPPLPTHCDHVLFDTASAARGGTGQAFDWNILSHTIDSPYFLAGGLSLDNVEAALSQLSPYCVDVSSGVETDGAKDAQKIDAFVRTVRRHSHA